MTEKLGHELDQVKIKQTSPIRFRDEAINKIRKQNSYITRLRKLTPLAISKRVTLKRLTKITLGFSPKVKSVCVI